MSHSGPELTVSHTPDPAIQPVPKMLDVQAQQPTTVSASPPTLAGTCRDWPLVTPDMVPLTVADTLAHVMLNVSAVLDQRPTTVSGVYQTQLVIFTDTAVVTPTGQD